MKLVLKISKATALFFVFAIQGVAIAGDPSEKNAQPSTATFGVRLHQIKLITGTRDKDLQKEIVRKCSPEFCNFHIEVSMSANNGLDDTGHITAGKIRINKLGKTILAGEADKKVTLKSWKQRVSKPR